MRKLKDFIRRSQDYRLEVLMSIRLLRGGWHMKFISMERERENKWPPNHAFKSFENIF